MNFSGIFSIAWFLHFLCWLPESHQLFEVKLKPSSPKLVKPLGTNLVSTCEVVTPSEHGITIQWFDKDKKEVHDKSRNRIYTEKDGAKVKKLYVTKIENRDAGRYSCLVHFNNQQQEKSFELALYKEITFDDAPPSQHPPIYKDALIRCDVSGEPTPIVSWKRNDTFSIGTEGRGRYRVGKKGLVIKNITQSDNGFYTCSAEVEVDGRYDEKRIDVIVYVPPKITKSVGDVNGTEGDVVVISCNATGFPQPIFKFFKNDKEVQSSKDVDLQAHKGRVLFASISKEDEGYYKCIASNEAGNDTQQGYLKVFVPPKITAFHNITKNEQDSGVLVCKSKGDPNPAMSIRKDGSSEDFKMGPNEGDRIMVSEKSAGHLELFIRKLLPSDRSAYVCKSRNHAGSDEMLAFLDIQYKPRFAKDQMSEFYSWPGSVHNITCSVDANPIPIIHWIRYDRILENNDTYRIFQVKDNSSLQIRIKEADQKWIFGDYFCQTKNAKGENQQKIKLLQANIPGKPKVSFKESTATTATLLAEPPRVDGGIPVLAYRVEYERLSFDYSISHEPPKKNSTHFNYVNTEKLTWNKHRLVANYSASDIRIENLKPNSKYTFRVRAKNEVGVGAFVEVVAVTADRSKPHPISISSPEQGSNSYQYKLTWERPKTGGFPINKYDIKYRKSANQMKPGSSVTNMDYQRGTPGNWIEETHVDDPQNPSLSYTITDLEPLTNYEVVIHAHNQLGGSEAGHTFHFRTSEVRIGSSSRASISNYKQVHMLLQLSVLALCLREFSL